MRVKDAGVMLVETIVVIAIITILAGVVTPVTMNALNMAKKSACSAQLHQIGLATQMYLADYDDKLPPYGFQNYGYRGRFIPAKRKEFKRAISQYGLTDRQWYCPSDRYARTDHVGEWHDHLDTSYTITFDVFSRATVSPTGAITYSTHDVKNNKEFALYEDQTELIKHADGTYERVSAHSKVKNVVYLDGHVKTVPVDQP